VRSSLASVVFSLRDSRAGWWLCAVRPDSLFGFVVDLIIDGGLSFVGSVRRKRCRDDAIITGCDDARCGRCAWGTDIEGHGIGTGLRDAGTEGFYPDFCPFVSVKHDQKKPAVRGDGGFCEETPQNCGFCKAAYIV